MPFVFMGGLRTVVESAADNVPLCCIANPNSSGMRIYCHQSDFDSLSKSDLDAERRAIYSLPENHYAIHLHCNAR
jgi:hypothetical protein